MIVTVRVNLVFVMRILIVRMTFLVMIVIVRLNLLLLIMTDFETNFEVVIRTVRVSP